MKRATADRVFYFWIGIFYLVFLCWSSVCEAGLHRSSEPDSTSRCAAMEAYSHSVETGETEQNLLGKLNRRIDNHLLLKKNLRISADQIIRIPVVVHIIHNQSAGQIGGKNNPNISDEQIQSQIRILNEDFRRKPGTPGFNNHPAGVDTGIEFFLAEIDPDGAWTNGITRNYYIAKTSFNPTTDAAALAGIVAWPSDQYLNIWVCTLTGVYLGVAQFPSLEGIPGLDNADARRAQTDGVIIDYRNFGIGGAVESNIYNQGRTTTHEVGHWLGLLHTWGIERCGDDYCEDTPWTESANTESCNEIYSNCFRVRTRNMIENYMDYSPDRCMNIFTYDQMQRMHAVLEISPRRVRLVENARKARLEESEYLTVRIYPNPIQNNLLQAEIRHKDFLDTRLSIIDSQGKKIHSSEFSKIWSRVVAIPVHGLSSGIYYLVVSNEKRERKTIRFVVN